MAYRDRDIAFFAPGINITMSLNDLFERIASINNGFEFARLNQIDEEMKIVQLFLAVESLWTLR